MSSPQPDERAAGVSQRTVLVGLAVIFGAVIAGEVLRSASDEPPAPPAPITAPAPAAPPRTGPTATPEIEAAFTRIYDTGLWGTNEQGQGHSGSGSTQEATAVYRTFLQQFLKQYGIRSVVDAGCGDWEFSQHIDWTGIDYRGFDIVASVVEANTKRFGRPGVSFTRANIVEEDLPPADLLIVKHVLQHLPLLDIHKFLRQMPKYKHVLLIDGVSAGTLMGANSEIAPGQYRTLDLTAPPFNLPARKVLIYADASNTHQVLHLLQR
ncbi:MAG: class I SAM-dependent methyltransferase [Myxococcaceae bacterium]